MSIIESELAHAEYSLGCPPPLKEKFWGFTKVEGTCASELRKYLGIIINPRVRTFEYNGDPKYKRLSTFFARISNSRTLYNFLVTPDGRGINLPDQEAIFVRQDDPFAECHELGHCFVASANHDLDKKYNRVTRNFDGVIDNIAFLAIEEGVCQWIAIEAGARTGIPARTEEAILEITKLKERLSNRDLIRQKVSNYCEDEIIRKGLMPLYTKQAYTNLLVDIYKNAMALGYVYTFSTMEKLSAELSIAEKLSWIVKNPPTFAQLEQEVTLFADFEIDS